MALDDNATSPAFSSILVSTPMMFWMLNKLPTAVLIDWRRCHGERSCCCCDQTRSIVDVERKFGGSEPQGKNHIMSGIGPTKGRASALISYRKLNTFEGSSNERPTCEDASNPLRLWNN